MAITIEELDNKIRLGLENLKYEDNKPCFMSVEDTFTLTPSAGYPYAVFEIDRIGGTKIDTCKNKRNYTFQLQVFRTFQDLQGSEQEKRRKAKKQVAKIVDRLILLYDKNEFLDGLVDNSEVVNFQFWTFTKTNWKDGAGYMVEAEIVLDKLIFIK